MLELSIKVDRRIHRGEQAARESIGILGPAERWLDHRELVAAKARQRVARTQAAAQSFRHRPQCRIARQVSEKVIDVLEVIKIHVKHTDAGAVATHAVQGLLQPVMKQPAIRQTGQQIVC